MSEKPEYDTIADEYSKSTQQRSDRAEVLVPSAKFYLGDLRGRSVLDLACGDGFFTRLIKSEGAARVVGVDLSSEMIKKAQVLEADERLDIEYQVGDVAELSGLGRFDIVFAGFLLHYSPDVESLRKMANNIRASLKPGGLFVSFNENPFIPVHSGIKYGVETIASGAVKDGAKITRVHYEGNQRVFEFSHHHFEPQTYETALKSAGFSTVEWKPFVAASGVDLAYWDEYLNRFSIKVLVAR